jgi:ABC-2 type transport system permease protein
MESAVVPSELDAEVRHDGTRTSPPSWLQILRLARYQLRDYLLSQRFILMMVIVLIIGTVITAVIGHYRPAGVLTSSDSFYGLLWANGITIVIVFAVVIFGADAIAGEFQNKTGYFLMGLPIRRTTVYAGKYIAAFVAAVTSVVLFAVILFLNAVFYFGTGAASAAFVESFAISVTYLLAVLGATFLFSSLFKTSVYATLVVAVLFLFGFTFLQDLVTALVGIEPWFLISYAATTISYPFDPTIPAHAMTGGFGGGSFTVYNPTYLEGILIMVGYFLLTAIAGLLLFEREEFT